MESYQAILDLMSTHAIDTDSYGNCKFKAVVEYRSPKRNVSAVTDVSIIRNGYNDGAVMLGEAEGLSATDFHLDFSTDWQKYRYSVDTYALIITGKSQKMGGDYSVSILPHACV